MREINDNAFLRSRPVGLRPMLLMAAIAVFLLSMAVQANSADAAAVWGIKARWAPQHLVPGGEGQFYIQPRNLGADYGDESTITIEDQLPPGVTIDGFGGEPVPLGWSCTGVGTGTATCTMSEIYALFLNGPRNPEESGGSGYGPRIFVDVSVSPGASGQVVNKVTMSGGGGVNTASDEDLLTIGTTPTGFGFAADSFQANLYDDEYPNGSTVSQAGSHPFELRVDFDMNLQLGEEAEGRYTFPDELVRTIKTTLPKGLIGNPEATPKCQAVDFLSGDGASSITNCPANTQVGMLQLELNNGTNRHGFGPNSPGGFSRVPVYNLVPPKGQVADFGFSISGLVTGHILPTPDPAQGYAIRADTPDTSSFMQVRDVTLFMWGVPADPAHDSARGIPGTTNFGASSNGEIKPFLTLPSDCGIADSFKQEANSWQHPEVWTPRVEAPDPVSVAGCDDPRMRFEPDVSLRPTSRAAGGPTGLQVDLEVPQQEGNVSSAAQLYDETGDLRAIATPPLKKAVVTMPAGMTISTSAAQGLGSCSPAQIGLGTNDPVTCPDNSQYGTLTLHTPILPKDAPMTGRIYIAKQNDNPFNNFLSLYLAIQDPERGLLVKLPGKIDLDPVSGQITATFDDLPQFPVSDMQMNLKGGVRAALVNPSTCGTKAISATFYSWAEPNTPITESSSYDIAQKDDGSPCVGSLGERPFRPEMTAGTASPSAGSYSPFAFRLQRSDNDQEFSQLGVTLPKGLLAKISGIAKCSEGAIAQAEAPGRSGAEEAASPSCPASSQIGTTEVGSGVGQVLTYVGGKAYLAGPYKGAPLSMVVVTPILAGPYDLGVIAVRSRIDVNPETTQASVSTDPFPQIFKGIPVRIRDVQVKVDRANTMVNPTSCNPTEVTAHVTGTGGDVNSTADDTAADLSSRFQAANCANLPFKPKLDFKVKGGTHRGDYPALTATLRARPGDANIARTAVTLPHSEFLAQEHIRTVCTRVQFAAKQCPAASIYGYAKASSPLFDGLLEGPVYLRSSSNPLPDLVATLNGEINVVLSGRIDSVNQSIRNTFDVVPDAPVTMFTLSMQGGKKGLLVNSRNLCKGVNRADVRMVGQNGKRSNSRPVVANSCKKKARKGKKAKPAGKRRG